MGSCFSKKGPSDGGFSSSKVVVSATTPHKPNFSSSRTQSVEEFKIKKKPVEMRQEEEVRAEKEDGSSATKEIVVIQHRKSHDRAPQQQHKVPDGAASSSSNSTGSDVSSQKPADLELEGKNVITSNINFIMNGTDSTAAPGPAAGVRTSSCTKEEVDAILIQCGRLSRSSSSQAASGSSSSSGGRSRKYSGTKRSYDFDHGDADADDYGGDDDGAAAEERHHRERNRQSRPSPQGRRRRTPSREREQQNQRSNSKERSSGSGSRRVSRSPGKRSGGTSSTTNVAVPFVSANANAGGARPGKLVSVPATVSSLVMEKKNNGCEEPTTIKRIHVKRNVGEAGTVVGSRSAASPRAQSPARGIANGSSENVRVRSPARTNANGCIENQQPSLSCNSSRKAEQSPYRRNPLSEIDPNSLAYSRGHIKSKEFEADGQKPNASQGANKVKDVKCATKEHHHHQEILEEAKGHAQMSRNVTVTAVPQALTRSRSSRQSQDLDQNLETLPNCNPSYTSLLLEDIQNFHQKNTPNPTSFSLPPCVTKACSILEAVADLNCSKRSNLSSDQLSATQHSLPSATNLAGKKRAQHKDPFLESEIIVNDDLMEPSLHKYVTVRRGGRGTMLGEEVEQEESSGSNSFVGGGGQQHWGLSSSSWEPNSADSTDRWTSRSNTKIDDQSPLESGLHMEEERNGFSGKRRDFDHQQTGIGCGRVGGNRGPHAAAVAAST